MRILLVDDEPGIRQVCERALRQDGHVVEGCASGKEALPRLREGWDLILTDLSMPGGVDGNELIRRARAAGGADLILMTAFPTLGSTIAALKEGACDYLLKPFTLAALGALVHRLDEKRRADRRPQEAFGRFLSPAVARHLLEAPPESLARRELRCVTVLFADMRHFTSYAETVPAEEAAEKLDALLGCFVKAVQDEGGIVNKFLGDGAMALFGAPSDHPDQAGAAARAALACRRAVKELESLSFGYGLNTGEAAAGCLGTAERAEYSVIGAPVNVAARLEAAAAPGQILLGPRTRRLLEGRFELSEPVALSLKGLRGAYAVSELLGSR